MSDTSREAFEAWCERTCHFSSANNDWAWIAWSARDAEVEALKARATFLEGTVKSILDHINRGNAPERYAGATDFGISQDRGITLSFIKTLATEALR